MSQVSPWRAVCSAWAWGVVIPAVSFAQSPSSNNYTSFDVIPARPLQVGYYASAHKNCTPAALPVIRVIEAPKLGILTVRRGELKTNQVAGCPELMIPAQVIFYQARVGSGGTDHLVYEVTNSAGEVGTYDVTINIKEAPRKGGSPNGSKI